MRRKVGLHYSFPAREVPLPAAKMRKVSAGRASRCRRGTVGRLAEGTRDVVVAIGGSGRVGSGSRGAAGQPAGEVGRQGGQRVVAGGGAARGAVRAGAEGRRG